MSLTPQERVLISPEEVLEGERASLIAGMAIARAWRDPGYRDRLLSAPKEVLTEEGLEIPESLEFRVFEDTPHVKHVSITRWTSEPEELV
ncbi:MAG: nitrile hydratase subunit alpha, partial [Kitasatospora sp.]|nr:nitrile hydratase subunit alpha [Kitasatospora sp.]